MTADGKRIFRMTPPLVIWWGWVALVVFSVGDLLIQGHRFFSLRFALGGLAVTGLVYACTLWPKVIADNAGIQVRNPIRVFNVPWLAVRGIYLADSVEVRCARPAPKKDKTVYSWALSSPRRARARAQLRAWQWDQGKRNRPSGYSRLPQHAQSLVRMTTAEIMARELAVLADEARFQSVVDEVEIDIEPGRDPDQPAAGSGSDTASRDTVRNAARSADAASAADGAAADQAGIGDSAAPAASDGASAGCVMSSTWAWPPLAAVILPAIGFVIATIVK